MKSYADRKADLEAAIKRLGRKKGATLTQPELQTIYDVSAGRFVNIKREIVDFPADVGKEGNALVYPGVDALKALLAYHTRNEKVRRDRARRVAMLRGQDPDEAEDEDSGLSPTELLRLDQLAARTAQRMVDQGELIRAAEVEATAERVFSTLARPLNRLSMAIDPNGTLEPAVRTTLDDLGRNLLLKLHKAIRGQLEHDADEGSDRASPARKRAGRTR